MKLELEKEWYNTEETQHLTGYDSRKITKYIRAGKIIDYKKEGKRYFIRSEVIKEIIERESYLRSNYYTYKEVAIILGKDLSSINDMIYANKFNNIERNGRIAYIRKKEVDKYITKINGRLTVKEAAEITGLSRFEVDKLIQRGILEAEQENKYLWYIYRYSLNQFIDKMKSGYTIEDICSKLNIHASEVNRLSKIGWIKLYNIKKIGLRVSIDDFQEYLKKKEELCTVQDISKEYNLKESVVRQSIILKGFVKQNNENNFSYLVRREEIAKFFESTEGIKLLYHGNENYNDFFDKYIEAIIRSTEYKDTISLFKEWAKNKIKKSKAINKKNFVNYIVIAINKLSGALNKEFYSYTDNDIKELLKDKNIGFSTSDIEIVTGFLTYCKIKRKEQCVSVEYYNVNNIIDKGKRSEKLIYSKEQWISYCTYLTDIEKHKKKAIDNRRYAETWLFILLHLSLAWRSSDIKKVPNVSLELVGIDDFSWFDEHYFTLEVAQNIINDLRRRAIGIKTNKTGHNTHLVIGLTIPTAIAFAICELHRRKSLNDSMKILSFGRYRASDFDLVLGEKLPKFSSLKCNRTLLTYQFETAVNKEGKAHIAYQLCSVARSHKNYVNKANSVTSVYLITTNTDASTDNVALHLFERGFFGWQIGLMLSLIYDTENWNMEDKTTLIKKIKNEISPIAVESVSEYVYTRHEESKSLLEELMLLSSKEIRNKLEEISKFKSPSLIDYSQCIKGIKNCPYSDRGVSCLGCKYLIPTNYILEIVNVTLLDLIERLDKTRVYDINKRIKYTHMIDKLMFILMDFKRAYKNFDNDYIKSFIDLKKLQKSYIKLEETKFLKIKEKE